jgi:putative oxidoreductase
MFDLTHFTDFGLLFLRFMAGAVYAKSGYDDLRDPENRAKSIGLPLGLTKFLGVAEIAGGLGVIAGVLPQLAAIGLILIMLGAIQKKIFVWKTGFWGAEGFGWSYDLTLVSMLLVVIFTGGGRFVLFR